MPPGLLRTIVDLRCRAALEADIEPRRAARGVLIGPVEPWADNVSKELIDLARAGDELGFRRLAACVMPVEEIDECWVGTRGRLRLPT